MRILCLFVLFLESFRKQTVADPCHDNILCVCIRNYLAVNSPINKLRKLHAQSIHPICSIFIINQSVSSSSSILRTNFLANIRMSSAYLLALLSHSLALTSHACDGQTHVIIDKIMFVQDERCRRQCVVCCDVMSTKILFAFAYWLILLFFSPLSRSCWCFAHFGGISDFSFSLGRQRCE
jgi:hypothetical protein